MNWFSKEENTHLIFEVSMFLKGLQAIAEIIGGILTFFITKAFIISTVLSLTQDELAEDPRDFIARYLIQAANNVTIGTRHFVAIYLLSHGIIKLFLVIGLLRKKLWAYPSSIVIFSLFILYQLYRYFQTHSIALLLLTFLDVTIIILTVHEYRYLKSHNLFVK